MGRSARSHSDTRAHESRTDRCCAVAWPPPRRPNSSGAETSAAVPPRPRRSTPTRISCHRQRRLGCHETTAAHPAPAVEAPRVIPVDAPKDEQWWKSQMRALETQYDHDLAALSVAKKHVEDLRARLTPSENGLRGIGEALRPTQIEVARSEVARLEVVASNSKAAVERLREDARRASVPPGWLRWP